MPNSVPSSEHALRTAEYQRLYVGACQIDNHRRRFLACYIILVLGRLGLRIGELQHLREAWIDWEDGVIRIPKHDPCGCRRCWIQAGDKWGRRGLSELVEKEDWEGPTSWKACSADRRREIVERAECCSPESLKKIVLEERFSPKYDRSARTISFGWSERLTCVLMTFFNNDDCLELTQQGINDIIEAAAENAPGIDPEHLSSHNLRATGLTFIANTSINAKMLRDLAGWEDLQTAVKYIRQSGRINTMKMYRLMGRGEDAPPVVPEEPEFTYPVLMNPTPFQGEPVDPIGPEGQTYDADVRHQRAEEDRQSPLKLRHPRTVNIPTGRAGIPTEPELQFDITESDLPGHIDASSDIFDSNQSTVQSRMTTLAAFQNPHTLDRSGDDPRRDWRQDHLQMRADSYGRNGDAQSVVPGAGLIAEYATKTGSWMKHRLQKEWDAIVGDGGTYRSFYEQVIGVSTALLWLVMLGILMAHLGIALNPINQQVMYTPRAGFLLLGGSAIGVGQVLWSDYCVRLADDDPRLSTFLIRAIQRVE